MALAVIASLGGTPEPIAHTIREHNPEIVCYLASQQSVVEVGTVHKRLKQWGHSQVDFQTFLVDDVNDLAHCFGKALECAAYLENKGVELDEVMVDCTGGTKPMAAALVLATARKGAAFSYVGGGSRTKDGLGVVETGTEKVYTGISPWQVFAVEEWQHLVWHIEHFQYEAALELINSALPKREPGDRLCWRGLHKVVDGLWRWDQFNHRGAVKSLRQGVEEIRNWTDVKEDKRLADFIAQSMTCLEFLMEMASATSQFKEASKHLVIDLLSNADRRAAQGRYDDAVARLYRALEMQGQIAFRARTGSSTSNVSPEIIPPELREEYSTRYGDAESGKVRIPLHATFRLLKALGDPVGAHFFAHEADFKKILYSRNQSILAHGTEAVSRETFENFRDMLRSAFDIHEEIRFPQLKSPF